MHTVYTHDSQTLKCNWTKLLDVDWQMTGGRQGMDGNGQMRTSTYSMAKMNQPTWISYSFCIS